MLVTESFIVDSVSRPAEDGFLVVEQLFSEEEIRPMSEEIDCIIAGRADYMPARDLVYEPGSDPPQLRNAFRVHFHHPLFMDFARSPKITRILEASLGWPLRLYSSQLFAKPARVGTVVPKHQDMAYWPFEPYELVTAWIALDDTTLENGCVRFVAGSHRLGLLPHELSGVLGNSLQLAEDPRIVDLPEKVAEAQRGSCIFHHCLTVHRSEPNQSRYPRRGLAYIYMSPRVRLTDASQMKGPIEFPELTPGA
jgi:phytanoyl-CoA hydroxylase